MGTSGLQPPSSGRGAGQGSDSHLYRPVVARQAGTFSVASNDVLKTRAMKKAKRRSAAAEVKPGPGAGRQPPLRLSHTFALFQTDSSATFKGFQGFSMTTAAFSGFGKSGAFTGLTNGSSTSTSTHATGEGGS